MFFIFKSYIWISFIQKIPACSLFIVIFIIILSVPSFISGNFRHVFQLLMILLFEFGVWFLARPTHSWRKACPEWGEASQVGQAQQCSAARLSLRCVCHLESLDLVCRLEVPCHTLSTLTLTVNLRLGAFAQSPLPSSELATRAASWWPSLDEGSMVPPRVMSLLSPLPSSELVEHDVPLGGPSWVWGSWWLLCDVFSRHSCGTLCLCGDVCMSCRLEAFTTGFPPLSV